MKHCISQSEKLELGFCSLAGNQNSVYHSKNAT
uniref:Uncharacterized protein n=1 Tax=Anguilla anguilla TaxID=7936 RepID=A0A0E9SWK3_ANGAN